MSWRIPFLLLMCADLICMVAFQIAGHPAWAFWCSITSAFCLLGFILESAPDGDDDET